MKARENPFASWRIEQVRYRLDGLDWEELLGRFDRLKRRAALVGDHGTGKTTLLEEFAARFRQQGFRVLSFRLTRDEPTFREDLWNAPLAGFGTRDVVLLDGAEQLNRWEWKKFQRFTRLTGGLLITTHRAGRLPTLYECRTTPQLLASLVTELVRVPEWPVSQSPAELYWQHRGNLREAFRDLYDVFAEASEMDAFDTVANIRAGLGVAKRLGVR
jgi:hypothetical protein